MTRELPHASRPAGCPDPALIAAHADRRLTGAEAAQMDEHVAGCPDCYDVFASTVQFGLAEPEAEIEGVKPAEARFGRAGAGLRSRMFVRTVGLAAAAALVVALGLWAYRTHLPRPSAPLVAELADALGARRLIEPRLTGGFRHGRLITLRSGETPQGLDAQPPTVLAAVARIRERAESDPSPEALGALGVTYLVSGDAAAAVRALESGSAQKPDDARLLSDLSAAYLVRAKQADEPADIPKALEAAERAVALPEPPVEAYFNRALALEALHLVDAARKAWQDYLDRDPSSPWADEARQHLDALSKVRRSSVAEDKARVRAAIESGPAAIDRLAEESPSIVRAYFEDDLLPAWSAAHLVGHPDASLHRERAAVIGDALLRTTTDALPRDAARALAEHAATPAARDPLRLQALGYRSLHDASHLLDLQQPACAQSQMAHRDLEAGGSPYSAWAGQQMVTACLMSSSIAADQGAAVAELARLDALSERQGYFRLQGRVRWLLAIIASNRGELTSSLERYRSARAAFQTIRDEEGEAYMLAGIAEDFHLLGETRGAWGDRERSLALLGSVTNPLRRHVILNEALLACLDQRLPRTALHFGTALVEAALMWSRPLVANDALIRRAAIHHSLGADDLAASDLAEARLWAAKSPDEPLVRRQEAEANALEGEILLRGRPEEAAHSLQQALDYFRATAPSRVPPLLLWLARTELARGLGDGAEEHLQSGISALEKERTSIGDAALQVSFFDQALPLFDDMVRLQIDHRHDPERALAFVERGHARQIVDALAGTPITPLDPTALRRQLPEGVALVYYVPLEDRLFEWALSREESRFIERPLAAADLSRLVAAHRAAVEARAPQDVVRRTAARLHDELVRPFIPFFASQRALVFIPDGVLQGVPFASLWDRRTGRYLVQDYLLGVAPSGTVFVRASAGAAAWHGPASRVLVLGNPEIDHHLWSGLPNLPGAAAEAAEVAALYPHSELLIGSAATKAAFLDSARVSHVVHYAGHAAASADSPSTARLLLAPDADTGDSGALYLRDLDRRVFPRTRVVVLAACRTGAGRVSRVEGALSLGRPFLGAGVPEVVASLWDIDDTVGRTFFVAFHRALLVDGDPVLALRRAQIAFLHGGDATLAHPASWAAFICMGGVDPHSLSKGETS